MGRYYLDDVRIPNELNYKPDESMVYETTKFKAGVLRFSKWRLDVQSLIEFFTYNMVKDNWTFVNMFKGKRLNSLSQKLIKHATSELLNHGQG